MRALPRATASVRAATPRRPAARARAAPTPASSVIAARRPHECSATQPPPSPPSGAVATVRQIIVAVTRPRRRSGRGRLPQRQVVDEEDHRREVEQQRPAAEDADASHAGPAEARHHDQPATPEPAIPSEHRGAHAEAAVEPLGASAATSEPQPAVMKSRPTWPAEKPRTRVPNITTIATKAWRNICQSPIDHTSARSVGLRQIERTPSRISAPRRRRAFGASASRGRDAAEHPRRDEEAHARP